MQNLVDSSPLADWFSWLGWVGELICAVATSLVGKVQHDGMDEMRGRAAGRLSVPNKLFFDGNSSKSMVSFALASRLATVASSWPSVHTVLTVL